VMNEISNATAIAALTILRNQAMEAAIKIAEPGEHGVITEARAEMFLSYWLRGPQ